MEEAVGRLWHRWVTRAAERSHPQAAATLAQMQPAIRLLFRAAGGAGAVRLAEAGATRNGGARRWIERVAGAGTRSTRARLDPEVLALPPTIAVFDDAELNRDVYVWLAALAAHVEPASDWLGANVRATERTLQSLPGLVPRYERLRDAVLAQRPRPNDDAEAAVQAALRGAPIERRVRAEDVAPVWLWVDTGDPASAVPPARERAEADARNDAAHDKPERDRTRRRAERVADERDRAPFMMFFRAENLLTWGEFVRVNRPDDDDPDENARAVADDLEVISVADGGARSASRVRFDLDLPSAAADDRPLGPGIKLPEWDFRRGELRPDHCAVQTLVAQGTPPDAPPLAPPLRQAVRQLRRRLQTVQSAPRWAHAQPEGDELDLDAWVRREGERAGVRDTLPAVMRRRQRAERSLAMLLLADLSLSTDAYVPGTEPPRRVVDVIRDALMVCGETLAGSADAFEMLGFSSVRRTHVRLQHLKGFDEPWSGAVRARVHAIKPGYYTRIGAALRAATLRLQARPERQRLLLLLTDGKPNDLDVYEGRYGLEDTRRAVHEARVAGLTPFCVSIDEQGGDYLAYLFGEQGYVRVARPAELASRLARVVLRLSGR